MTESKGRKGYLAKGTDAEWYVPQDIDEKKREEFRNRSRKSQLAAIAARNGEGPPSIHPTYTPRLDPSELMPKQKRSGLKSLSLFSGGGGLDLAFDIAGFEHIASYELLDFAAATLTYNRPNWTVYGGMSGDVTQVDWRTYAGKVDVIHGGPPCQPFSTAGRRRGSDDARDMFPEFVRAVLEAEPLAFVAENVKGLDTERFAPYIQATIMKPLDHLYTIRTFQLTAASFGVPQRRTRVIFVGLRKGRIDRSPTIPDATHDWSRFVNSRNDNGDQQLDLLSRKVLPSTMGARESLGLPDIGIDDLAPTIRCSLTGPRGTTSILSSTAANRIWQRLEIWPNGVATDREAAQAFPANFDHYRLSTQECALLQGFPSSWTFGGAVYKILGQIGNSVAPPMGYAVAKNLLKDITG